MGKAETRSRAPQAARLAEERMRNMFVMHAFQQKAGDPQSIIELDKIVEWVSCAAELENRQIRKETVAVYMLVGV